MTALRGTIRTSVTGPRRDSFCRNIWLTTAQLPSTGCLWGTTATKTKDKPNDFTYKDLFRNGKTKAGSDQTVAVRLVVGADGVNSRVARFIEARACERAIPVQDHTRAPRARCMITKTCLRCTTQRVSRHMSTLGVALKIDCAVVGADTVDAAQLLRLLALRVEIVALVVVSHIDCSVIETDMVEQTRITSSMCY